MKSFNVLMQWIVHYSISKVYNVIALIFLPPRCAPYYSVLLMTINYLGFGFNAAR